MLSSFRQLPLPEANHSASNLDDAGFYNNEQGFVFTFTHCIWRDYYTCIYMQNGGRFFCLRQP